VARDFSGFELESEHVKTIEYDLTDVENIGDIYEQTWEIDVLINNAGIMYGISYEEYTTEKKDTMMKINLEAQIELISVYTKNNDSLRIVNSASIAWEIGKLICLILFLKKEKKGLSEIWLLEGLPTLKKWLRHFIFCELKLLNI